MKPEVAEEIHVAVDELQIIDSPIEDRFNYVTALASQLFDGAQAAIVFYNGESMWAKSTHEGIQCSYSTKESLCGVAVQRGQNLELEDLWEDRYFETFGAIRNTGIRFYANRLLTNRDGVIVGSFCIRDFKPRLLSNDDIRNLDLLGGMANELVRDFERAIEQSEGQKTAELSHLDFGLVFRNSPAPMWLLSAESQEIIDLNERAIDIIGCEESEILGKTMQIYSGVTLGPNNKAREIAIKSPGGKESVLSIFAQEVCFDGENYLLAMADDITVQVERTRNLKQSQRAAEAANRAKSDFLSRMSHELRTPMNAILGFSQLLAADAEVTSEQADTLEIINRSGEHLLSLINDVLEMSKIEAGKIELNCSDFCLKSLLEDLNHLFIQRAESSGLDLVFNLAKDIPEWINGDAQKIRQVLVNLIGNSLKFTDSGSVTLKVYCRGINIHFEVVDTGIGVKKSQIHKLFKVFSQTDDGASATDGTGLGLAISKRFVEMMSGEISVESNYGEGSTFAFYIPFETVVGQVEREPMKEVEKFDQIQLCRQFHGSRVLVVDDQLANRLYIKTALAKIGCEVIEATNGLEAFEKAAATAPDCIFMDVRMPVMNGLEATQKIRDELDEQVVTPIIAVTGNAFEKDRAAALNAGCSGFLPKPVKLEDLYLALQQALDCDDPTAVVLSA